MATATAQQVDRTYLSPFIEWRTVDMDFNLHPSTSGATTEGIEAELSTRLLSLDTTTQAIILGFRGVRLLSHLARIHRYFPYISVRARLQLELFRPPRGDGMI